MNTAKKNNTVHVVSLYFLFCFVCNMVFNKQFSSYDNCQSYLRKSSINMLWDISAGLKFIHQDLIHGHLHGGNNDLMDSIIFIRIIQENHMFLGYYKYIKITMFLKNF